MWIWKTDTIRGNFVQAAEDARSAVRDRVGKDLAAIGDELAQFLDTTGLEQRLPAFLALSHYGVYTPRFTNQFVGRLSFAHTDFTIDNLLRWVQIIRDRGSDNIYQQPMTYWAPSQFGLDNSTGPRNNPMMSASREEI